MNLVQLKQLPGTMLLDLRVDALFRQCGLPEVIVDNAPASQPRQAIRWGGVEMKLSSKQWEMEYSRQREPVPDNKGWSNPEPGSITCLNGLSGLRLHIKGEAGFLTVKKRTDNKGYITSYTIPEDLYAAHQVVRLAGNLKQGMSMSNIQKMYGVPDEVLNKESGIQIFRYWVVDTQKQVPVSVHAVDFEIRDAEKICKHYTVHTSSVGFVQEKFDALLREWEKHQVLD